MANECVVGCEKHVYLSPTITSGKLGVLCSLDLMKLHNIVMLLLCNITYVFNYFRVKPTNFLSCKIVSHVKMTFFVLSHDKSLIE